MTSKATVRRAARARRRARTRKKLFGSIERPRLVVHRTLNHIEGQMVDDDRGVTLLGVSTRAKDVQARIEKAEIEREGRVRASFVAGRVLAERAKEAGISRAVFDRGGYRYHGRVRAFAEGARDGGLSF